MSHRGGGGGLETCQKVSCIIWMAPLERKKVENHCTRPSFRKGELDQEIAFNSMMLVITHQNCFDFSFFFDMFIIKIYFRTKSVCTFNTKFKTSLKEDVIQYLVHCTFFMFNSLKCLSCSVCHDEMIHQKSVITNS